MLRRVRRLTTRRFADAIYCPPGVCVLTFAPLQPSFAICADVRAPFKGTSSGDDTDSTDSSSSGENGTGGEDTDTDDSSDSSDGSSDDSDESSNDSDGESDRSITGLRAIPMRSIRLPLVSVPLLRDTAASLRAANAGMLSRSVFSSAMKLLRTRIAKKSVTASLAKLRRALEWEPIN